MRNVHSLAYKAFTSREKHVKLYNASKKTVLDVYPIIDFEDYILHDKITSRNEELEKAKLFWDKPPQYGSVNG